MRRRLSILSQLFLGALVTCAGLTVAVPHLGAQAGVSADTTQLPLDPAVRVGRLENGLTYYVRRNARPENRVELRLVVNAGSVLEDEDQRGLAHFVEHMLFNGTRRFAKNDLIKYLESIGVQFGADLNAYTSFDATVYILPVPTDKPGLVERSFEVLEDWAHGALFDSTEVVAERGVVLEEWRSGLGADSRIRDKQFPILFRGSRYAERLPIGLPETIRNTNPEPLKRFYRDWYRPDLMAVVAVGDVDPAKIEALIRSHFGHLRSPSSARPRAVFPVPANDSALVAIASDPEQPLSTALLLFKHPPRVLRTVADYRRLLVEHLYNSMLNDRLSELVRRPQAPFSVASSSYGQFVQSSDVYQLVAAVPDGGIVRGVQALVTEARRADRHGFLPSELERAKARLLRGLESAHAEREKQESERYASEYVAHFLSAEPSPGIEFEYETARRVVPAISIAEVNALGRSWITEQNRVIAIAVPEKAGVAVPTEREILAALRAADTATVSPWTETVSDAPLVAQPPTPGRIVSETRINTLGVTEWRLSNGARVLIKPTTFKADEVLMRAWSFGGTSNVTDADYAAALLATTAAERGGAGAFDAIALGRKLAGKQVQLAPTLDNLVEGFNGRASPKDLETLFQLLWLKFTSPRSDSVAFDAFKAQATPFFANRSNDPEAVFGDTVIVTMGQGHPRALVINQELLQRASFNRAYSVYRDRFQDADDFTFLFVGAVNVDSLRPLVERWIGALPTTPRTESWRDVGMRAPAGPLEKRVRKGQEPKSQTLVFFAGEAPFTPEHRHALRSLAELLEMKLLDALREELGGTYSVSVQGQSSKHPRPEFSITIAFGSAPDRADSLYARVRAVIDSVRAGRITDDDVQKVREQQVRALEVAEKENGYWLANIAARLQNGEDPTGLLGYRALIDALTPAAIRTAAGRYMDPARAIRFVLLPDRTTP